MFEWKHASPTNVPAQQTPCDWTKDRCRDRTNNTLVCFWLLRNKKTQVLVNPLTGHRVYLFRMPMISLGMAQERSLMFVQLTAPTRTMRFGFYLI